jgi:hypothetical protein
MLSVTQHDPVGGLRKLSACMRYIGRCLKVLCHIQGCPLARGQNNIYEHLKGTSRMHQRPALPASATLILTNLHDIVKYIDFVNIHESPPCHRGLDREPYYFIPPALERLENGTMAKLNFRSRPIVRDWCCLCMHLTIQGPDGVLSHQG